MAQGFTYKTQLDSWIHRRGLPRILVYYTLVNILVYLIEFCIEQLGILTARGDASLINLLALPASLSELVKRPWTLLTYMFYHQGFFHILFNMLWLWVFGRMFLQHYTPRQFQWVYILGGLAGGLAYILAYNTFPYFASVLPFSLALGASASVMAITLAAIVAAPNELVYLFGILRLRVIWVAIGIVAIDFFSITQSNAGGHIAHLGGALFGFLYSYFGIHSRVKATYKRGFTINFLPLLLRLKQFFAHRPKNKKQDTASEREKEIERILAKLARGGYASLSNAEKERLFRRQ